VIQAGGVWMLTGSGGPDVGQFSVTQTLPILLFTMRDFGLVVSATMGGLQLVQ
jgi:hypothetical protein